MRIPTGIGGTVKRKTVAPSSGVTLTLTIPLRLGCGQNDRGHWAKAAKRVKAEREAVGISLFASFGVGGQSFIRDVIAVSRPAPVTVTLTRIGGNGLDDDNLVGSCKAVRDEVCAWLGFSSDADVRLIWHYTQEPGPWGVRVAVAAGGDGG